MKRNSQFNQKTPDKSRDMSLEKIKTHYVIIITSDARNLTRALEKCKKNDTNVIFVKSRLLHCIVEPIYLLIFKFQFSFYLFGILFLQNSIFSAFEKSEDKN